MATGSEKTFVDQATWKGNFGQPTNLKIFMKIVKFIFKSGTEVHGKNSMKRDNLNS